MTICSHYVNILLQSNNARKANEMSKYKNTLHCIATKLAQAGGAYAISVVITRNDNTYYLVALSFAFLWLATDVVLWVYSYILRPSAQAIYNANK